METKKITPKLNINKNFLTKASTASLLVTAGLTAFGYEFSEIQNNFIVIVVNCVVLIGQMLSGFIGKIKDQIQNNLTLYLDSQIQSNERQDNSINALNSRLDYLENKILTITDTTNNIQITNSRIENDVKELKIDNKYTRFNIQLINLLENRIIQLTSKSDEEISELLQNAFEQVMPIIEKVLKNDFKEINHSYIYENLKRKAKIVRGTINCKKLDINENKIEEFKVNLKNELLSIFNQFGVDVQDISENLKNGERGKKFKEVCIKFVTEIVNKTNQTYNFYKAA